MKNSTFYVHVFTIISSQRYHQRSQLCHKTYCLFRFHIFERMGILTFPYDGGGGGGTNMFNPKRLQAGKTAVICFNLCQ
jgi:hypothetical protein